MNFDRFFSTVAMVMVTLVLFFGCGERTGEKDYARARSAFRAGDLVQARVQVEKAIKRLSLEKKAEAQNLLGVVCWKLNDIKSAKGAFEEASRGSESLGDAHLNLAFVHFQAGNVDDASQAVAAVLVQQPTNVAARALQALIGLQAQQIQSAMSSLDASLQADSKSPAAQNLATIARELYRNRQVDAALEQLKRLHSAYPAYAPAVFNIAALYDHWKKDASEAQRWYARYLTVAASTDAHVELANNAIARLKENIAGTPAPRPAANPQQAARFFSDGARLSAEKKYAEAIVAYQKAIEADPDHEKAYYNAGLAYYALADYANAVSAFQSTLQLAPVNESARYMLAAAHYNNRNYPHAEQELRALLKTNPSHAQGLALHGMLQSIHK